MLSEKITKKNTKKKIEGKNNRNTCVAYKMAGIPVFLPVVLQDLTTMAAAVPVLSKNL